MAYTDPARTALHGKGVHCAKSPAAVCRADDKALWVAFFSDMAGNLLTLMSVQPLPA